MDAVLGMLESAHLLQVCPVPVIQQGEDLE
jgi:hypothetical protein